jgi:hypothetical protein
MIASTFVLADSFDAMPLELYDTVEAFTAPTLEPEYLDFDTCLHCDDLRIIEAVNQFNQDTFAPCPCCTSRGISRRREKLSRDNKPRFNMPAIYLHLYSKMSDDKMTIWERKHRDSLLNAA